MTANDLFEAHASPLGGLTSFAAYRPDGIAYELLHDGDAKRHARVLRVGLAMQPREWRLNDAYPVAAGGVD